MGYYRPGRGDAGNSGSPGNRPGRPGVSGTAGAVSTTESVYTGANGEILVTPDYGKYGASETFSRINRAQWNDYKARFGEIEQELMDYVNNDGNIENAVNRAVSSTGSAFDSSQSASMRSMQEIGASMTDDQQQAIDRKYKFSKNLAMSDAANVARMQGKERRMMALAGGSNSFSNLRGAPEEQV